MEKQLKRILTSKKVMVIAAFICCAAILATGTLAYFTAEETAYNVITTGALDMTLHEETTGGEPWPEEGVSGVMPGTFVDKVPYIENSGSVDFYARISLDKIITPAEGVTKPLDFTYITLDINDDHWIEQDGFYYYYRALKPGEKTEPLFTKVSFGAELGNEYMGATVKVTVNAQAVQSRNNTDSPLTASGWSALEDVNPDDEIVDDETAEDEVVETVE